MHMRDVIAGLEGHAQRLEADAALASAKDADHTNTVAHRVAEELRRFSSGYRQIITSYQSAQ